MSSRDELYDAAVRDFGRALDRLAGGYEADAEKRRDLRQDIHLQIWRSLETFDGRCGLRTWVFRVAHNTAVSYVNRERRNRERWMSLEQVEELAASSGTPDIDRGRALEHLSRLVLSLKPVDRQIMISYLEEMDTGSIADITGLSTANVAMKIHRIKNILARRFQQEHHHG
ncbi:MAG: sigma-70 family RNA polymerase sigma factor [Bryobacteraceae bacterium]